MVTMLLNALKSSSLIIADARGVRATPSAQPAAAAPKIKEEIFMVNFLGLIQFPASSCRYFKMTLACAAGRLARTRMCSMIVFHWAAVNSVA